MGMFVYLNVLIKDSNFKKNTMSQRHKIIISYLSYIGLSCMTSCWRENPIGAGVFELQIYHITMTHVQTVA